MIDFPVTYKNGNCSVTIEEDGTKIREYESIPIVDYPESIDLKITNYCNLACDFCHEMSDVNGEYADIEDVVSIFNGINYPIEIAIGGGNPFSYYRLMDLLTFFKSCGYISNITINAFHLSNHIRSINCYIESKKIYGIGISYHSEFIKNALDIKNQDNVVIHLINGYHGKKDFLHCLRLGFRKILILGYKDYGRGVAYNKKHTESIVYKSNEIKSIIPKMIQNGITIAFDNLAIEQLNVKDIVGSKFDELYMGDEGQFTFYVDCVKQEFAISSASIDRYVIEDKKIKDMFEIVKGV